MYTIIELQTTNDVTSALPPIVKETKELGQQEFHLKSAYAAVSKVNIHTVLLINPEGEKIDKVCYKHEG